MKGLSNSTGGHMILTDSFTSSMYKQSFARVFNKDADDNLLMGFNASLEVLTTKELKVTGLIGHAISMNKKSASVGETECGIGNTCSWKMCGIDPEASYGIYFEIASQGGPTQMNPGPQKGMMQFLTYYQHSAGQYHLRGRSPPVKGRVRKLTTLSYNSRPKFERPRRPCDRSFI